MSYNAFAEFYDILTENVDYKVRSEYISNFFSRCKKDGKRLLDIACGTGSFGEIFADLGYSVTGVDLSEDMLTIAEEKCRGRVNLIKGDMCDLKFRECFDFCICMLDSVNHLTNYNDLKRLFKSAYNSLCKDGLFVFDVNTVYKHKEILADNSFVFDYEDFFLSWDNEYVGDNTVRILIDIFSYNGKNYDRFSEEFFEKAYTSEEICNALDGFDVLGIFDELTQNPPGDESQRLYFICKKV